MPPAPTPDRSAAALSKDRIVTAAVAILDAEGAAALTFKALTARLRTGSGAIYWHVADKGDLLRTAADRVVTEALRGVADERPPPQAIRAILLAVFDALETHPWVGALITDPSSPAALQIFEAIGSQLLALHVPATSLFDFWSALVNYLLGAAGQSAARVRSLSDGGEERTTLLAAVARRWQRLDPQRFPFLRQTAPLIADHDDRAQYLAGVDLILQGINAETRAP